MFFLSDAEIDKILDRIEIRVRKVLGDYGITQPIEEESRLEKFIASLPRRSQSDLEREGQLRIKPAEGEDSSVDI